MMDRQIRKLGIALVCCFTLLFVQITNIQVFSARRLQLRPDNTRELVRSFSRPRGPILAVDGTVLASSVEVRTDVKFQRQYPTGDLFGPVTGFYSLTLGTAGVERTYDEDLAGTSPEINLDTLSDLFVEDEDVGTVHLTLHPGPQTVARDQLAGRLGSVVALDPRTGAIDAMYSNPTYDPGPLSTNTAGSTEVKEALDADPSRPLRFRAYRDIFFPGSTFKVVTASAGVESGQVTETNPDYPVTDGFVVNANTTIDNFGGSSCGGTLFQLLRVSCNSGFAQMGVDMGIGTLSSRAEAYGFNSEPPIDLPDPVASQIPTSIPDDQGTGPIANAAIGQGDVSSTPLQMALVAAGIANGGSVMVPHVMQRVTNDEGEEVKTFEVGEWQRATTPETADVVRRGMVETAANGTATGLLIPGLEVGGKTGTAETGTPGRSHAWIIGFAGPPGQPPTVAVAVLVEAQEGTTDEQTGGRVAAPIARAVMEAVLAARGGGGG